MFKSLLNSLVKVVVKNAPVIVATVIQARAEAKAKKAA